MKIKGYREFKNVDKIKENLKEIIKQKGECLGVDCQDCIFNKYYIKIEVEEENLYNKRLAKAKEILKEIKENEKTFIFNNKKRP